GVNLTIANSSNISATGSNILLNSTGTLTVTGSGFLSGSNGITTSNNITGAINLTQDHFTGKFTGTSPSTYNIASTTGTITVNSINATGAVTLSNAADSSGVNVLASGLLQSSDKSTVTTPALTLRLSSQVDSGLTTGR